MMTITYWDNMDETQKEVLLNPPNSSHPKDDPNPEIPQRLRELIVDKWDGTELTLFFNKTLEENDVNEKQDHITVPISQLAFANNDRLIRDNEFGPGGALKVRVLGTCLQRTAMSLEKMHVDGSSAYVFYSNNWYIGFVFAGKLRAGDVIQAWFFRDRDLKPCFAFVKPEIRSRSGFVSVGDVIQEISSLGF